MGSRDRLMAQFRSVLERAGTDADLIDILSGPEYAEACSDDELEELIDQFEEISRSAGSPREALPLVMIDYKRRIELKREAEYLRRGTGPLTLASGTKALGPFIPVGPVRLEGQRVVLRELTETDASDVFAYASEREVTRFLSWGPSKTLEESRSYIRRCRSEQEAGTSLTLGTELKAERRIIGAVSLFNLLYEHSVGELGFILNRRFWGQGLSLEMIGLILHYGFTVMRLERIESWVPLDNVRSWRILERIGMVREGILRRHRLYRGEPKDRVVYGLLRLEWERQAMQRSHF